MRGMMEQTHDYRFEIAVRSIYIDDESEPDANKYVFAYTPPSFSRVTGSSPTPTGRFRKFAARAWSVNSRDWCRVKTFSTPALPSSRHPWEPWGEATRW